MRSVFIPEDDTWLCVYQAASLDDVRDAVRWAGLPVERVRGVISTNS